MWQAWVESQWQSRAWLYYGLRPLSWLFALLARLRRTAYHLGLFKSSALPVPVVVVGNISVGGVGKTPLVLWLATALRTAGFHPAIISRGYGGHGAGIVTADADPMTFGDEPILLAKRAGCPVWVGVNRVEAGLALLTAYPNTDVILCDDGLQHYALKRCVEIAVVHTDGLGNGARLPAGPLREGLKRLKHVDMVVAAGAFTRLESDIPCFSMQLTADRLVALNGERQITPQALVGQTIVAVAGIGHPQRFFKQLMAYGLTIKTRVFPDHHAYSLQDFVDVGDATIVMTEKDAVKCTKFALANAWYLPVTAKLQAMQAGPSLDAQLITLLTQRKGQNR